MRYLSVCSGIEAATVAWHHLGWRPLAFSEIEPFPRAVLEHHYPDVPLHGDFTVLRNEQWIGDADVLVGGTPCQAFSVAGLRRSLDDARGNLSLEYIRLADAIDDERAAAGREPCITVWENVPGVLSVKDNAFGCFLAGLVGESEPLVAPRGKWTHAGVVAGPKRAAAWRIIDAQYVGLAQRRRRVFVVASAREGFDPFQVLFEPEGVQRHSPPSRKEGQGAAGGVASGAGGGGWPDGGDGRHSHLVAVGSEPVAAEDHGASGRLPDVVSSLDASFGRLQGCSGQDANHGHSHLVLQAFGGNNTAGPIDVATAVNAHGGPHGRLAFESETFIAHAFDARQSDVIQYGDMSGPLDTHGHTIAVAFSAKDYGGDATLEARTVPQAVAIVEPFTLVSRGRDGGHNLEYRQDGVANTVLTPSGGRGGIGVGAIAQTTVVRRLTPVECERLQGFPDGYTAIPWRGKLADQCPDGPRYKALGNSMAVPCMRFIGERLDVHLRDLTDANSAPKEAA